MNESPPATVAKAATTAATTAAVASGRTLGQSLTYFISKGSGGGDVTDPTTAKEAGP